MAREEDKHRGPEYVPAGPVRIRTTSMVDPGTVESRILVLEDALAKAIIRLDVMGDQIASLQMAMPREIPKP